MAYSAVNGINWQTFSTQISGGLAVSSQQFALGEYLPKTQISTAQIANVRVWLSTLSEVLLLALCAFSELTAATGTTAS